MATSITTGAAMHIYARLTSGHDVLAEWSDTAHHRESLARPGWRSIRRFMTVPVEGCEAYDGFELITEIDLATVSDAALIADHSYTPTPMPAGIVGLQAKRAVYERVPAEGTGAVGAAMLYVLTDFAPGDDASYRAWRERDAVTSAMRDAGCVGVTRWQWVESPATTLARDSGSVRGLEQFEVADVASLGAVARLATDADAHRGAPLRPTGKCSPNAARSPFPRRDAGGLSRSTARRLLPRRVDHEQRPAR